MSANAKSSIPSIPSIPDRWADGMDDFQFSAKELKKKEGIFRSDENRKEICVETKPFHEAALLGTVHQLHGWACPCTIRRKGTQF